MVKYIENMTDVVFAEIPDEVGLALNISNCQNNCVGCFEAFLKKDIGDELTEDVIDRLVSQNDGIDVVIFMGEGNDPETLKSLAKHVREACKLKTALYSGRTEVEDELYDLFDYVKVGPYMSEFGPLNRRTTNQRLYMVENGERKDITYKFWEHPWEQNCDI